MNHASQASPVMVLYAIMVLYSGKSMPMSAAATSSHSAATPLSDSNNSHNEEYESVSRSKLGLFVLF